MELPKEALERSVLVVAHPDDELLWFSSILDEVEKIVVVFDDAERDPDLHAARRASLAGHEYRSKIVNLEMPQTGSHNRSDWPHPRETDYGLELTREPALDAAYRDQADRVARALGPHLAGSTNLFTHNPWGEYGHEDHVQVNRVVTTLAGEMGATVWFGNYVSGKSGRLMRKHVGGFRADYFMRTVDRDRARDIAETYIRNGAWTFEADYSWFPSECFVRGPLDASAPPVEGSRFPVNYLRVPFDPLASRRTPAGLLSRLRRKFEQVAGISDKAAGDAATG